MAMDGETISLQVSGQDAVSFTLGEWEGIRTALDALARFRKTSVIKPHVDRATLDAPKNGQAWTAELDADLCRGWYAGEGLAVLATRFGRTEGAIASRLVKLDCVADLDEARLGGTPERAAPQPDRSDDAPTRGG